MGCQNSKLNGDILAIPPKLRPLLWRKIEELRRKRKGSGENNSGTLSKKELLTEGGREESDAFSRDHDSLHENEGLISEKTSSQDHDSVSSSVTQPKATIIVEEKKIVYKEEIIIMEPEKKIEINKEIENQERSVIIYDKEEKGKEEEEKEKEEEEGKEKEKENEREREVKEEDRKEDQKDDEEDEREYIGPSSPSFRVYFIESLQDKEEDDDEDEDEEKEEEEEKLNEGKEDSKEDENDTQKEWSEEINSENVVLINSNEEPKTKIIKKRSGKSRMRFRRALCRGGPVAVKHLLNVKSCYHPNRDVRASLLARKSTS